MIRVFVVSAVRLYREGLGEIFRTCRDLELAGAAANATEGRTAIARLRPEPDLVLCDVAEPVGVDGASELIESFPGLPVLAMTVPSRESDLIMCAEAGVAGFLTADASRDELIAAVKSAARGEALVSPQMTAVLLRRVGALARELRHTEPATVLTTREREIVGLIDEGLSNKQIAQRLCIELPTVKNHVHHILDKLGVHRRTEAAALLRRGAIGFSSAAWFLAARLLEMD